MKKVNYAAIDIGSNAVRLLIKSVNEEGSPEGLLRKVQLIRIPLRLGEDAFTTGEISEGKAEKLIRLMKAYKQLMKIFEVSDYRACATSAMRDARNGKEITRKIEKKTGIRVEIIRKKRISSTITTSNSFLLRARIICMSMSAAAAQKSI